MIEWISVEEKPLGKQQGDKWTLFEGYDSVRLYAVLLSSGRFETYIGYIDDAGTLCHAESGDDVGWQWDSISHYAPLNLPNAEASGPDAKVGFAGPDGCDNSNGGLV